jgi:hypothetical protein
MARVRDAARLCAAAAWKHMRLTFLLSALGIVCLGVAGSPRMPISGRYRR